jgi:RNA polymerase sigma-70 factor, ECF subfamily
VETRELLQDVSDCIIDQLTERQRTVLVAVAINGTSTETIARELDSTPGAIYKSLHDGRAKLKRLLPQPVC